MLRSVNRLAAVNGKNALKQKTFVKSYATAADKVTFEIDKNAFVVHQPKNVQGFTGPNYSIEVSKEDALKMYRMMQLMRKFEIAADEQYKQREIRGFCHLYDGQEAVCTGIEFASTKDDHVITAYRDHVHQLARGDTARRVMAELFGKSTGCSKGKGGSMHMYLRSANFFGGNGIVGAQVPVGAGLAFGLKYWAKVINKKPLESVAYAYFGDGASNQGQVFEAYNMAKLWNIPAIFVCEDNKYGMGTSVSRSSASTDYYSRGDYVPGIKVDGMDVFSVMEATRYAKQWAVKNGPVILHMSTYRYHGHSMSDPGISYRSRDEIKEVRQTKDPIENLKKKLFAKNIATQDVLDKIDEEIAAEIADCVEFAKKSELPPKSDFVADIYLDKEYSVKGTSATEVYHVVNNVLQN